MDRVLEFIDLWMKAQKEFMENWVKSQKEFMENWLAATQKMQESFLAIGGPREGETKETFDLYKAWLTTMVNSSKAMSEEEFAESLAFCQTLPGAIAVQTAAHVAWRLRGPLGALVALRQQLRHLDTDLDVAILKLIAGGNRRSGFHGGHARPML